MSQKSLLLLIVASSLAVFLPGCNSPTQGLPATRRVEDSKSVPYQVTLQIAEGNEFIVSMTNNTKSGIVLPIHPVWVLVYHESAGGRIEALTWDGRNADIGPLGPLSLVYLGPYATYIQRKKVWKVDNTDRTPELKRKGRIYAVVKPIGLQWIDANIRKEATTWPLLDKELRSSSIDVPVSN